jgi:transaldolase
MKDLAYKKLTVKIFADGADLDEILRLNKNSLIKGFTTNPTLMRKSGIRDYKKFASEVLKHVTNKPVSFEVFADDAKEIIAQSRTIASWGSNVYVKIPALKTTGSSNVKVVEELASLGIKVNITALMTVERVHEFSRVLNPDIPSFISIFAGRIADTGRDPVPILEESIALLKNNINAEVIWASPRESLNVVQANAIGCHVITATSEILAKIEKFGYPLEKYSLDTVRMFFQDAQASGFKL